MESVHYYFDESGEKGFLDPNFSASDIGLIAGIALPARLVSTFDSEISQILSRLDTREIVKAHAVELFRDGKNLGIKDELLNFLKNRGEWLLIYEAIYPLGLYKNEKTTQELISKYKPNNPKIKTSKNENKLRIYTALLSGIIIKLDELCLIEGSHDVRMISDQIDVGILREALITLDYLKQDVHVQKMSGFDPCTGQIVRGSVKSKVTGFDTKVKHVSDLKIENSISNLSIAADIVSNTLYRHLKSEIGKRSFLRLHSRKAVDQFILKDRIAFVGDDYIMDTLEWR